jgi:GGDEF domain-containing protein
MRLGGDEFLCALPGVTLIEARRRLGDLRSELRDGGAARSMSFGLSELRDGESPQELIDRADRELLAARAE